jgi:succinate dehydrogenase / fumarate reductase iron-sulfur subunit
MTHAGHNGSPPDTFEVRILRQDGPGQASYWERHRVRREPEMNVISVLQRIAANATTVDGKRVAPVAWDCNCLEEVCGACTMVINRRVRQACSALVDRLLQENPQEIELQPAAKFPVVRDLLVDRSRMFRALEKIKGWIPVDGYYDLGPGPKQSPETQEAAYPLSQCMTCGCCLEACPQYTLVDVIRQPGETDAAYAQRRNEAYDRSFIGAAAISQGGNAQNCVAVCPKNIPLTTSIGQAGRATTLRWLQRIFDR